MIIFLKTCTLKKQQQQDNPKWVGLSMVSLGRLHYQYYGQPQYALDTFLLPAVDIFEQIQNPNHLLEAYDHISLAYEEISIDSAYNYYVEYVELKEKLFEEEKLERIQELETMYKVAKVSERKAQVATQRNGLLALSIFLALVIAAFALQYQRTRVKRILESQKSKEQKRELLDQLKNQEIESINAMMEIQGKERERIAADLHDRVGSLLATVKINYEALQNHVEQIGRASCRERV